MLNKSSIILDRRKLNIFDNDVPALPDVIQKRREVLDLEKYMITLPDAIAGICLEVSGNIDKVKFINAVKKLRNHFPILNSKLNLNERDRAYYEEIQIDFQANIINRESDETWRIILQDEWKKPFSLEDGPLSRFILIHSETRSEIIFIGHHTIIDGFGVNRLMVLLLQFINNPGMKFEKKANEPLPSLENLKNHRPKLSPWILIKRGFESYFYAYLKNLWRLTRLSIGEEEFKEYSDIFYKNYTYVWADDQLNEEETVNIYRICKEHNVTINSVLTVAYMRSRLEFGIEYENNRQQLCVDLRRHLEKETQNVLTSFASSIDTNFVYDESKSFWENTKVYHNIIMKQLKENNDVEKAFALSKIPLSFLRSIAFSQRIQTVPDDYKNLKNFKKLGPKSFHVSAIVGRYMIKTTPSICLTNMGVGRYTNQYGDLKIENCVLFPSAILHPFSVLLASITVNKKLGYTINAMKRNDGIYKDFDAQFDRLKKRFKEFLTKDIYY
ncbi:MAG: condensation domain-containing protein [Oscillospiraceae bacterium]|nr:condensation domain-containing protein [Oscillospiraceae bacterium]